MSYDYDDFRRNPSLCQDNFYPEDWDGTSAEAQRYVAAQYRAEDRLDLVHCSHFSILTTAWRILSERSKGIEVEVFRAFERAAEENYLAKLLGGSSQAAGAQGRDAPSVGRLTLMRMPKLKPCATT